MSNRVITKVSFIEGGSKGVEIGYTTFDANGLKDRTKKSCPHQPHITFQKAMEKLKFHILFLCEFLLADKYAKIATAEKELDKPDFRVCGVSISGDAEKEGVVLTGYKTLSNGLGFVFNTPNTKFDMSDYKYKEDLIKDLEELKAEANEYLSGKYGAVQGDLFKEQGEPALQE